MAKLRVWLLVVVLLVAACDNVGGEVSYEDPAGILGISINTWGEVELSAGIPTKIGTFSAGVIINPTKHFDVKNVLVVRLNGEDHIYDLHGKHFEIEFEPGYYEQVKLSYTDKRILLILRSPEYDQANFDTTVADRQDSQTRSESSSSQPCTVRDVSCSGAPQTRLCVGMSARVTPGLPNRLRDDNWDQIGTIPAGGTFEVVGGPRCHEDYTWWKVNYQGKVGWTAEGEYGNYWLEPVDSSASSSSSSSTSSGQTCGSIRQRFDVGDTVVVSRLGDNLRILTQVPGGASNALALAVTGDHLEIIGDPICSRLTAYSQNTWYYYIFSYTDAVSGWVADGPTNERWICPTSDPNCD